MGIPDRRRRAWTIGLLAALLMVLRVDFWWWGTAMPPVLFDTLNLPMLYQLAIFVAGWALVIYTVNTPAAQGE
jgi:hypothetical protein